MGCLPEEHPACRGCRGRLICPGRDARRNGGWDPPLTAWPLVKKDLEGRRMQQEIYDRLSTDRGLCGKELYRQVLWERAAQVRNEPLLGGQEGCRQVAYQWCLGERVEEMGPVFGHAGFGQELERVWAAAGLLTLWCRRMRAEPRKVRAVTQGWLWKHYVQEGRAPTQSLGGGI